MRVVTHASDRAQFFFHHARERLVDQYRVDAVDDFPLNLGAGSLRRTKRGSLDALPDCLDVFGVGIPYVIEDFRKVGHDIRRVAARGNDVMNPGLLRHVLAHQVDHVIERLDTV